MWRIESADKQGSASAVSHLPSDSSVRLSCRVFVCKMKELNSDYMCDPVCSQEVKKLRESEAILIYNEDYHINHVGTRGLSKQML